MDDSISLPAATGAYSDDVSGCPRRSRPYLSVVSPVYMAEKIVPELCMRLDHALTAITSDYEIILVCDGSPDNSWSVMTEMVRRYPKVKAVRLSRNFGQHYALTAGLDLANGDWTVVMDCDLQDQPEEIASLLDKAKEGYDIVLARRIERQHTWWKRYTSSLFYKVFSLLSGFKLDGSFGSFRIMSRTAVEAFRSMRETYRMFGGLVEWIGFNSTHVVVEHAPRFEGRSSYNFRRLLRMALDGMISFSNRPLYISIALGLILSATSSFYGAALLLRYFTSPTPSVPGWLSTITATTFLGGLILLNQGVLGIYLGRLYNQSKGRPLYVVDRIVAAPPAEEGE